MDQKVHDLTKTPKKDNHVEEDLHDGGNAQMGTTIDRATEIMTEANAMIAGKFEETPEANTVIVQREATQCVENVLIAPHAVTLTAIAAHDQNKHHVGMIAANEAKDHQQTAEIHAEWIASAFFSKTIWLFVVFFSFFSGVASAGECTITLAGDVMLGRYIDSKNKSAPPASIWGDLLPSLKNSNLTLINHEFTLTNAVTKEKKTFNFKARPNRIKSLKAAGIDFTALGNNHSLDYGLSGLTDTIKNLDKAGIAHAGAGLNLNEASRPTILTCGPYKIGVISFTNNMPEWAATEDKPGVFYLPVETSSLPKLIPIVENLKRKVDYVIVSAHWGRNWDKTPPEIFQKFAKKVLDAGADIWMGHSGHIIQGIEVYKGKPIFYCLGDIIDDYEVKESRNDLAFLAKIEITDQSMQKIRIIPTAIKHFQAGLAKDADFDYVVNTLKQQSAHFNVHLITNEVGVFVD